MTIVYILLGALAILGLVWHMCDKRIGRDDAL